MDLRNLFEDAEADTINSVIADRFYVKLYNYIYTVVEENRKLAIAEYQGEDCLAVGADQVPGRPNEFSDTLIIFQNHDGYRGGTALRLDEPNNGYRNVVILKIPASTPRDIMNAMHRDSVHSAFLHEFTHVLDFIRHQGNEVRGTKSHDPEAYHNDTLELNAFFHNLAEPLLKRLRLVHTDGVETLDLFSPLEDNFRDWLANRVKRLNDPVLKRHWATLTERNRRRAISRLKALYDRVQDVSKMVDENP